MQPTICFKLPTIDKVTFTIECLEEYILVRGNAVVSGDAAYDKEIEDDILERLSSNEWAWCCVKVTAKYKDQEGTDYLGCCSYDSEKDFIDNSGYYDQMKESAFNELLENLKSLAD